MANKNEFDKYKLYGAYHWDWYGKRFTYTRHVDFLKRWVNEKNTIQIGAGDGFITKFLGIQGVENNPYAIKLAALKGVSLDLGDPYDLPYEDEKFESALMTDVINQFRSVVKPLNEARRVITKYLYVDMPSSNKFNDLGRRYHSWTPEQLVSLIKRRGFTLVYGPRFKADRYRYYFKFQKNPSKLAWFFS